MPDISEMIRDPRVLEHAEEMASSEAAQPLSVAIMGTTGVGKSSLLNALFDADLAVGDVRPTTLVPEPIVVRGRSGAPITFWDLPGIGESQDADEGYLELYRARLLASDVVLWAIHADSRSTTFERHTLDRLLHDLDPMTASAVLSKVSFVLTKADSIHPPPWIYAAEDDRGRYLPSPDALSVLDQKAAYFEEQFLAGYTDRLTSRTYNSTSFQPSDPRLTADVHQVTFHGHLTETISQELKAAHPGQEGVIERLRDNHRVLVCSSPYRYNLIRLLSVVVNKIGARAVGRFERLVDPDASLDLVPVREMRTHGNFIVWDTVRAEKVFDLTDVFPESEIVR